MSLATTMIITSLFLQIITSFHLITTASQSPQGLTMNLIQRRANYSRLSNDQLGSPYANTVFDTTEYLIKLQIGTPPVEIQGILDTGSDIIWTQCLPCLNCYHQQSPLFDPSKSSSYKPKTCKDHHPCPYEIIYGDQTYSKGTLAWDTLTIQSTSGQPFVMPDSLFGCGNNNSETTPKGTGIVGLSRGPSSLISQMGDDFLGLFSYCFSGKGTSKINFGANAIVAGDGTVSTTMFQKRDRPDFYYLNLDAVSVGDTRVETLGTPFHAMDGNIMIDSGTSYSYLPDSYCNKVTDALDNAVKAQRTSFTGDMLCYNSDDIEIFPEITMHFEGGADMVLDKYNIYDMGPSKGVICLAIVCVDNTQEAIFGNRAQNNLFVGYDISSEIVSFKPTDCSALWN
ncbi:unnamed protein product [Cochlearia groenlandica]